MQVAHMRMSFGLSWYSASFFDIFSRARGRDIAPDASQAATLANAARSTLRRKTHLSIMEFFFGIQLPTLSARRNANTQVGLSQSVSLRAVLPDEALHRLDRLHRVGVEGMLVDEGVVCALQQQ